jgi:hypothetical protein
MIMNRQRPKNYKEIWPNLRESLKSRKERLREKPNA